MFLETTAAALAARAAEPKRIAAIVTEYRPLSHADVIVGKYLEGYRQDGKSPGPRSRIVSMTTEQVPKNDMSRDMAKKHGVPIFRTVHEALTLGGDSLKVDGVLMIGEHGDYPLNDKGQKMYPRYEMFLKITDTFRQLNRSVPLFSDKHLSYNWVQAKRMYEISRELGFPFMAGSSVPVAYRVPQVDTPYGAKLIHAGAVAFGGIESYGFHMLESMQSLAERRAGGETGVAAVQCLEGDAVWNFLDQNSWAKKLLDACLSRSEKREPGELRGLVKTPAVYLVDYRDGLRGAGFMMTGAVGDFTAAVSIADRAEPLSVLMKLQRQRPHHHFACLVQNIEKMYESGKATYPVERTLLTSGILDFGIGSRFDAHRRIETPQLSVKYQSSRESHYCTEAPVDA